MLKKTFFLATVFSLVIAAASCGKEDPNAKPEVKRGVAPVADQEIAVIEMEKPAYGTIKIELYSNIAPQMVEQFKTLAKSGFYNGVAFHRINPQVVQGGDPNSKDDDPANDGNGKSDRPNVPAELSDIKYERGIVGAARSRAYNSANSQFFITLGRTPGWDTEYTVFGKVVEGMNNVDTLAGVPKSGERPLEPVKIKSITFQSRQ